MNLVLFYVDKQSYSFSYSFTSIFLGMPTAKCLIFAGFLGRHEYCCIIVKRSTVLLLTLHQCWVLDLLVLAISSEYIKSLLLALGMYQNTIHITRWFEGDATLTENSYHVVTSEFYKLLLTYFVNNLFICIPILRYCLV